MIRAGRRAHALVVAVLLAMTAQLVGGVPAGAQDDPLASGSAVVRGIVHWPEGYAGRPGDSVMVWTADTHGAPVVTEPVASDGSFAFEVSPGAYRFAVVPLYEAFYERTLEIL